MFIEAKDDGSGGDNWSYKSCKAPVKSSPVTHNAKNSTTVEVRKTQCLQHIMFSDDLWARNKMRNGADPNADNLKTSISGSVITVPGGPTKVKPTHIFVSKI